MESTILVEFVNQEMTSYGVSSFGFANPGKPFDVPSGIGKALIEEGVFKLAEPEKPKKEGK